MAMTSSAGRSRASTLVSLAGVAPALARLGDHDEALRVAREVENATIVFIVCDRGDRYLSTGVFPA